MKNTFSSNALRALFLSACALLMLQGCATAVRDVETPVGVRSGDQFKEFQILGVLSRATSSLNRANALGDFVEEVTVNVPAGTELIVPAVRGFTNGYGSIAPDDVTALQGEWHPEDHNFGLQSFNISVEDIDAVDSTTTPATQTAKIQISLQLADENGDDKWFGSVRYNLICLGHKKEIVPLDRRNDPN